MQYKLTKYWNGCRGLAVLLGCDTQTCIYIISWFVSLLLLIFFISSVSFTILNLFAHKVICHNPPFLRLQDQTDHYTKPMEHWCTARAPWSSCYFMMASTLWWWNQSTLLPTYQLIQPIIHALHPMYDLKPLHTYTPCKLPHMWCDQAKWVVTRKYWF